MKIGKVIMGMALIVLGILLISMFWPTIGAKTAEQVWEDYDFANTNFKSYDVGDTVLIKDEIKDIKCMSNGTTKLTRIVFEGKNMSFPFKFKGDLTGEYKKGDTVLIILKVEKKNNTEQFEGNFTGLSSDKIHKLYLGGNAFFCGIILIGVLVLIYGLLKKKPKPVYYAPQPYPAQPMAPQYPQPPQYPPQPPPQYPPPPQYQQPQAQQLQQVQPKTQQQPPPPQYQQPPPPTQQPQQVQQMQPEPQQPTTLPPAPPLQPTVKPEPTAQVQPQPVESQQPVPQPVKKGLFQRLKKLGRKGQPQPAPVILSEKPPALEQPTQPLEIKPPVHEPVQPAQQPTIEKTAPAETLQPEKTAPRIPKFCPDCGAETKGRGFCGNCGTKLGE